METLKIRSFTHYLRKKRFSDPLSNSRCDARPNIAGNWRLQFIVLQSRWTVALGTVTFCKIHSSRVISIGEGKYHKKTIWLILFGVQLLRISTDETTSSPEMRKWFLWFILLGLVEGESWLKSYVSYLWHLRLMFVDELLFGVLVD